MGRPRDRWMPLDWGDYLRDTRHLTTEQHGAYMLLIAHYWTTGALPDDDRQLAHIAGLPTSRWRKHRPVLHRLFRHSPEAPSNWWHKRVEEEMAEAATKHGQAKQAAEERWRRKREADADAYADAHADGYAGAMPRPQEPQEPQTTRGKATTTTAGARGPVENGPERSVEWHRRNVLDFITAFVEDGDLGAEEALEFRHRAQLAETAAALEDLQREIDSAAAQPRRTHKEAAHG